MAINVRVRYVFGQLDQNGAKERVVQAPPGVTVFQLLRQLGFSGLELLVAVNGTSVPDRAVLNDGDELTLIPALSGG